jgi:CBS domain-containing protein
LRQVEAEAVMRPEEDASEEAVRADGHMTVKPDTPMTEVLTALREGGFSRVLVVHDDRVVGVITREDLESWLQRRRAVGA